jgi:hypothetical protein
MASASGSRDAPQVRQVAHKLRSRCFRGSEARLRAAPLRADELTDMVDSPLNRIHRLLEFGVLEAFQFVGSQRALCPCADEALAGRSVELSEMK